MAQTPVVPQNDRRREWGATTRGGWIILFLWQGSRFSTKEVAKLTGLTRRGAQRMMNVLELDFPIRQIEGKWQWVLKDDA